jgi:site-specific DNA-methyltransferase (adenine-specific)
MGWGTALKPAFEPITLARKPIIGTVANTILTYGTGGLNIDGCRVYTDEVLLGSKTGLRSSERIMKKFSRPNPINSVN